MTEYDYSPEAYERFIQTQTRVTNWVHYTEQHRKGFESAAPGAPGLPPVPRQLSPSIEEPSIHKASLSYPMAPIYHHCVPPLLSESSYVQIPPSPSQTCRLRPPPSKCIPPVPLQMVGYISPTVGRVKNNRFSCSSRHHHARVVSHSHPYHPLPLMTPIYTSPAASPFIPPPPITHMYSQGRSSSSGTRPVNSLREIYRKSSSLRKARPQTPPGTLLSNSSSTPVSTYQASSNSLSSAPFPPSPAPAIGLLNSGHGGSRLPAFSIPWIVDSNRKHGQYQEHHTNMSSTTLPRLDSTFIKHNVQEQSFHTYQRLDYQPQSHHLNICHSQDRRSVFPSCCHSHLQSCSSLRTQPNANYESKLSPVTVITSHNNTIPIPVPPRFPPDDRESSVNSNSSHAHPYVKQITPYVSYAPQLMQHPDMLIPQLRA